MKFLKLVFLHLIFFHSIAYASYAPYNLELQLEGGYPYRAMKKEDMPAVEKLYTELARQLEFGSKGVYCNVSELFDEEFQINELDLTNLPRFKAELGSGDPDDEVYLCFKGSQLISGIFFMGLLQQKQIKPPIGCRSDIVFILGPAPKEFERVRYRLTEVVDVPLCPCELTGFSVRENSCQWTDGPLAKLRMPIVYGNHRVSGLSFSTSGFVTPNHEQKLIVKESDAPVFPDEDSAYIFSMDYPKGVIHLPIEYSAGRMVDVQFFLPTACSPKSLGYGADTRQLGISCEEVVCYFEKQTYNMGNPSAFPFPITGFSGPEGDFCWTDGKNANVQIPVAHGNHRFKSARFVTTALVTPTHAQSVEVQVNGSVFGTFEYTINKPKQVIDIPLPDGVDIANIAFNILNPISPAQLSPGQSQDSRQLGVQVNSLELLCFSKRYHMGSPLGFPFSTIGFGAAEGTLRWIQGNRATIDIPMVSNVDDRPTMISFLNTQALVAAHHSQSMIVLLNGEIVKRLQYQNNDNNHQIDIAIPRSFAGPVATIGFEMQNPISVKDLTNNQQADERLLGAYLSDVVFSYTPTLEMVQ